jgi:hypothetical protein
MRRIIEAVTVAEVAVPLAFATMLVGADPASAQGGRKAFSTGSLGSDRLQNNTLRGEIPTLASVNDELRFDEVRFFHGMLCW